MKLVSKINKFTKLLFNTHFNFDDFLKVKNIRMALFMFKLNMHQSCLINEIKSHSNIHCYNTRNKNKLINNQNTILGEFINIYNKLNNTELPFPKFKAALNNIF